jgi:hypothetical protein
MPDGFELWVKTASKLAELVIAGKVSHIDFDHDLGASTNTGYAVALLIEQLAYDGKIAPITWDVHTSNPAGRKNIVAAMENAERFWYRNKDND